MSPHPPPEDLPYLRTTFVAIDALARAHGRDPAEVRAAVQARRLPQPAYVLSDGTELVAPDFFSLSDAAGGDDRLAGWFTAAYERAAGGHPDADPPVDAWNDYLSGGYATCLRNVTPTTIVRKTLLVAAIERLLADPRPTDRTWLDELRVSVDALDVLEQTFAQIDRDDGPVSRDKLVTAPRDQFAAAWRDTPT